MNSATTLHQKTVGVRLVPAQGEAVAIASLSLLVMLSPSPLVIASEAWQSRYPSTRLLRPDKSGNYKVAFEA